jgi:hypothetical protein
MLPDMQKAITVTVPTESQHGPLTLDEIGPAAAALRERLVECCGGFVMFVDANGVESTTSSSATSATFLTRSTRRGVCGGRSGGGFSCAAPGRRSISTAC